MEKWFTSLYLVMVFYVDALKKVCLQPDAIKLCPELSVLTEKEVVWIVLAYDNYSPYRQYPERDREQKAMWAVFEENMPELLTKHSIRLAVTAYKSLQYNPKIALKEIFEKKINSLTQQLEIEESPLAFTKLMTMIDLARKSISELENEIAESVLKKGVIKGDQEMCLLEEFQQNIKGYNAILKIKI